MCSNSCFYRSRVYFHGLIIIFETVLTITLFMLISMSHQDLFFKGEHPDNNQLETIGFMNMIITVTLFFIGAIQTIILSIVVLFLFVIPIGVCPLSCVRIAMIAYCLAVQHNITIKSLPHLIEKDFEIPNKPLSSKHKRFIPYTLLGDNRTMRFGDKACSKGPQCKNRDLEHIFIFHFKGYNPQPRFFDLEQTMPGKNLYIGFHQTDPKSAMLIAQSREGTGR
ncbi:unnamed protein product [Adineta steineri]|uniref:Uncharacterized protein n=1 Tax=Adineta steineri TaxID=433720 RepID=A0A819RCM5_9BILA|nr:unnamed protein product [Adineta steineri]